MNFQNSLRKFTLLVFLIAGTDRLSVHSFGAAVDINVAHSDYWHDEVTDEAAIVAYRNRIPVGTELRGKQMMNRVSAFF